MKSWYDIQQEMGINLAQISRERSKLNEFDRSRLKTEARIANIARLKERAALKGSTA